VKLGELAAALELPLQGDASYEVYSLAPISRATWSELSFVVSHRFINELESSRAGAVIVPKSLVDKVDRNMLVSDNPYASYARASWLLHPDTSFKAGIHPTAIVDPTASVSDSATIGAQSYIGPKARVADGAVVGEQCVIGAKAEVGANTRLFARVTINHACVLGRDCRVQSGAVIGSEGFGFAFDQGWEPIHQVGRVVIGNCVHIGANTTIDRGALDDTLIADGVILDNQIQIAHNVQIGENTAIAGCVGIAGSTRIGANCQIGGASNIVGHLHITDGVTLSATSFVSQSISSPGRYSSGMPLQTSTDWKRSFVVLSKLNDIYKRIQRLEKKS